MKMAFAGTPLSFEQSKVFFDANFDHDHSGRKLGILIERETEMFAGLAGLLPCNVLNHPDYECGFVLRRSVWGRGYATEIGRGQAEYGLGELHLDRVLAQVAPRNHGSIAVLKKRSVWNFTARSKSQNVASGTYIPSIIFRSMAGLRIRFQPCRDIGVA